MVKRLITVILSVFFALGSVSPLLADEYCLGCKVTVPKVETEQDHRLQLRESAKHTREAAFALRERDNMMTELTDDRNSYPFQTLLKEALAKCVALYAGNDAQQAQKKCDSHRADFVAAYQAHIAERVDRVFAEQHNEGQALQGAAAHKKAADAKKDQIKVSSEGPLIPGSAEAPVVPSTPPVVQHEHRHTGTVSVKLPRSPAQAVVPAAPMHMMSAQKFGIWPTLVAKWAKQDAEFKQNVAMGFGGLALFGSLVAAKRSFCYRNFNRPNVFSWTPRGLFARKTTFASKPSGIPAK
jgi:hypothetical protein